MSDIGQIIVDRIKCRTFIESDIDPSFDCMDEYRYICIRSIMPIDNSFSFYLMGDWTNHYFSLPDGNIIDINHDIVKVYSFNSDMNNYYRPLAALDRNYAYLQ
jgi:hypothetical protein